MRVCDQLPAEGNKRAKNAYIFELSTTSLFTTQSESHSDLTYANATQLKSLRYLLDLNVYFDVIMQREHCNDAMQVLRLGINGELKLAVTKEFITELERTSPESGHDPLLEFARAFDEWPDVPESYKTPLVDELRQDIFPDRSLTGRTAVQDRSDLSHLAICIHYGAVGFITRENAILRQAEKIRSKFNLRVVSPADLVELDALSADDEIEIEINVVDSKLTMVPLSEDDRASAHAFLDTLRMPRDVITTTLAPPQQHTRHVGLIAKVNGEIKGYLSGGQSTVDSTIHTLMYIDESGPETERIIDHFLQVIESQHVSRRLTYVDLSMSSSQNISYETAYDRGYRKTEEIRTASVFRLGKWSFRGPVFSKDWGAFSERFSELARIRLPQPLPTFLELQNSGLFVQSKATQHKFTIPVRDFETLSSAFLVSSDRPVVVIPIRKGYAQQLLGLSGPQRVFNFDQPEAILRSEKAYFSRPPGLKQLVPGAVLLFYVSAHNGGNQAIVGIARTTSVQTIKLAAAITRFGRQGVLDVGDLTGATNKSGEILAITFDNYFHLPKEVTWESLRNIGCISAANLVTAQTIDTNQLEAITSIAYKDQ